MSLTVRMLLSSWLGWVSNGFCVAAFTPSVLSTWANRTPNLKPLFLYCWLVGDTLNLIGAMLSDTQFTQKLLAWWYSLSDLLLLFQLCIYGSPHPYSPRRWRGPENMKIVNERTGWRGSLADNLAVFSGLDDIKVMVFCVLTGTALFGLMTIIQLELNPDYTIATPTETDWIVSGLAWGAMVVFSSSRVVALVPALRAHSRGEPPREERFSIVYIALLMMNLFQLSSILTLSTETAYLVYEAPWLASACSPPAFDLFILFVAAPAMHKRWNASKEGQTQARLDAQEKKVEERLTNALHIARHNARYQKLLDEHRHADDPEKATAAGKKPSSRQARRDKRKLDNRRSQIGRYKEVLIKSRQQRHERTARAGPEEGQERERHHGSIHTFAKKVGRPYEQGYVEKEEQMSTEPGTTDEESAGERRSLAQRYHDRATQPSRVPVNPGRGSSPRRQLAARSHRSDVDSLHSAAPSLD